MLDIKLIRENPDKIKKSIKDRNLKIDIDQFIAIDAERRSLLTKADKLKNLRNTESSEIAKLKKEGKDNSVKLAEMKTISQKIKEIDSKVGELNTKIHHIVINIPNIPDSSVPVGPDAAANKQIREWGKLPNFSFNPLDHIELGKKLSIMDFQASAKLSGSGFSLFTGDGAKLVRALMSFMLDLHTSKHGY